MSSMAYSPNPYNTSKTSGIEWLGNVPEHWEVGRLKSCPTNVVDHTSESYRQDIYLV